MPTMSPPLPASPPGPPDSPARLAERLRSWLPPKSHLLVTQGVCLAIAIFLSLLGTSFLVAWLYSALIGTLSGMMVDLGRQLASRWRLSRPGPHSARLRDGWPGWGWMLPIIVLGCSLGYFGGSLMADALTGFSTVSGGPRWRGLMFTIVLSITAGLAATWFFQSQARLAAVEAEMAQVGRLAAETQLKLLQSQLEPHMLFNTLANLRALIGVDPERAQQMLDRLIDFLRATLNASRSTQHPLSAEFGRLGDYLALMQIRMGPRLAVQFELPEGLATEPVPPLLLQPLVENAIKHGLEPHKGGGVLRVEAQRDGTMLQLDISDSGLGLGRDDGGPPPPAASVGTGFGLTQVRERLHTLYGERASLSLLPRDGGGTVARVRLPLGALAEAPPAATA